MKRNFGKINDTEYFLYRIENDFLSVEISDFGATLVSFVDKKTNHNCVLNYSSANEYLLNISEARGATVGRNANRIAKGQFELNGIFYQCFINNGSNSLHGGEKGFMQKKFEVMHYDKEKIVLNYFSKHLEEGFPGNLNLYITYRLHENSLFFDIEGICDEDSILNITNHSYFNLGDVDITNHYLQIFSNEYALVDEEGLTLDEVREVKGSFDFCDKTKIGDNMSLKSENLLVAKGYDHNYLFENADYEKRAFLSYGSLELLIESDLPGMHLYSGNYLKHKHEGICFEAQYFPNGINYKKYKKPIIYRNKKVKHYIKYTLRSK